MAEVYIVGQICSAVDFREPNLFLRWNFQAGLCDGDVNNTTLWSENLFRIALEVHWRRIGRTNGDRLQSAGSQGCIRSPHWPSLGDSRHPRLAQAQRRSLFGKRAEAILPGRCRISLHPNQAGTSQAENRYLENCATDFDRRDQREILHGRVSRFRIRVMTTLITPRRRSFTIVKKDLIHSGIERYKISTISSGIVEAELSLVFKDFRKYNIHFD